jgi:hypothetical protein
MTRYPAEVRRNAPSTQATGPPLNCGSRYQNRSRPRAGKSHRRFAPVHSRSDDNLPEARRPHARRTAGGRTRRPRPESCGPSATWRTWRALAPWRFQRCRIGPVSQDVRCVGRANLPVAAGPLLKAVQSLNKREFLAFSAQRRQRELEMSAFLRVRRVMVQTNSCTHGAIHGSVPST